MLFLCFILIKVVWKDSLSVGCAMKSCSVKSPFNPPTFNNGQWYFCVCFYSPAGNVIGQTPYPQSDVPSIIPTVSTSKRPSVSPSSTPSSSISPSKVPSVSSTTTVLPSSVQSILSPTLIPSKVPSRIPSVIPSISKSPSSSLTAFQSGMSSFVDC